MTDKRIELQEKMHKAFDTLYQDAPPNFETDIEIAGRHIREYVDYLETGLSIYKAKADFFQMEAITWRFWFYLGTLLTLGLGFVLGYFTK